MTRRALLMLPFVLPVQSSGFHITGLLTATDQELQEGYFVLCGDKACSPRDALTVAVHPNNDLLYKPLTEMVGQLVQVSVFRP